MKLHSVLRLTTPREGRAAAYNVVEVVGSHQIGEHEAELACAPISDFAPVFSVREAALNQAGYVLDVEASRELEAERERAAAEVIARRSALDVPLPWEQGE